MSEASEPTPTPEGREPHDENERCSVVGCHREGVQVRDVQLCDDHASPAQPPVTAQELRNEPSRPIQIAVAHQRSEAEQWGSELVYVLCQNGDIYRRESTNTEEWQRVVGPWSANTEGVF